MASLLEVFGILFESDAEEVKKGAEEAGKATDDLEKKISATDKTTEKLGQSFLDLTKSAKGAIASVLGAGALVAATIRSTQEAAALGRLSEAYNFNAKEVAAWSEVIKRSGGTAEGFQSVVAGLQNQLTEFLITGGGQAAETLSRLGISAFKASGQLKTSFELLPELAGAFERLDKTQAISFGQRLGLDQATILVLQKGRREVEALVEEQAKLGLATEKDTEIAEDFLAAWKDFEQVFGNVYRQIAAFVLPTFTNLFEKLDDFIGFLKNNEDLIIDFFKAAGFAIATYYLPVIAKAAMATIIALGPY